MHIFIYYKYETYCQVLKDMYKQYVSLMFNGKEFQSFAPSYLNVIDRNIKQRLTLRSLLCMHATSGYERISVG